MSDVKFRVWKDKQEKSKKVLFRLIQGVDGVILVVCDEDGERLPRGHVLAIRGDGRLYLYKSVRAPGLKLNARGRIELVNCE